ncbi:WXG100 family type VII secretion target [Frankia sp. AgKG'84/4]|uniref:WXG100 family type VII secretion target n=1 Tax=Frankia sp. AgKG'84/4 TaxID=573490 RepID=UPI00200C8CBA|nr:WXG100 family type VII secretion target [Frankia sp. AgKG'84/4]MCL9797145.1 WXG100 family type VII secretion target [Frankia sp. AgKG'84/4]
MATYQFSPNGALDTADELTFVNSQLEQSLTTLTQKVNAFIAANEGQAPANYSLAQQQWNKGQADMNAALALGRQRLQEIHNEYVLGDGRGANVFGQLI